MKTTVGPLIGFLSLSLLALCLSGCGGGSTSTVPGPGSANQSVATFTATVNFNVATGAVTVTPSSSTGGTKGRVAFTGSTIGMTTTVMTNLAGSPGYKATTVALTNSSTSPLGIDPNGNVTGVAVLFGPITTTGGSSPDAVQLSNQTGVIPSSPAGTDLPYIAYPGSLASGKSTPAQPWNFIVPSGVTAFSVQVTVEANYSYLAPPTSASQQGSATAYVRTLAGDANNGYLNGPGAIARFGFCAGVATDGAGNVYVADNGSNAIRRITPSGLVSTVAGSPVPEAALTNGTGNVALFQYPRGLAVTPDGSTIYVADSGNQAIRRIAFTGGDPTNPVNWLISTIAGTGAEGGVYYSASGSTATFNEPWGICVDPGGNVYVSEQDGNRVRRLTFLGGDPSMAANWEVYLAAGDSSAVVGAAGDTDNTSGQLARFRVPEGIASDSSGNVYVADEGNCRIREISPDGVVTTLAGGTSGSAVQEGYVDGAGATAQFGVPGGVAVDSSGLVYVSDTGNNRIRVITKGGNVTTVAGTGTAGFADGTGLTATFENLTGVAVSAAGTVYVANFNDIRMIERINPQ